MLVSFHVVLLANFRLLVLDSLQMNMLDKYKGLGIGARLSLLEVDAVFQGNRRGARLLRLPLPALFPMRFVLQLGDRLVAHFAQRYVSGAVHRVHHIVGLRYLLFAEVHAS